MTAPAGSVVKLYVDLAADVEVGHWIRTGTGRVYEVISSRRQERGEHVGRQHLICIVLAARGADVHTLLEARDRYRKEPPPALVHEIRWYKRGRRR